MLSKTDLADPPGLQARLRRLNPGAPITEMCDGAIDVATVLGGSVFAADGKVANEQVRADRDGFTRGDQIADSLGPIGRDGRVQAFCLTFDRPLPKAGMITWLERLILLHGDALLGMRGILHLRDQDRPVAIRSVGHLLFPPLPMAASPQGDPHNSRVMFITRDLPRAVLEAGLPASLDVPGVA